MPPLELISAHDVHAQAHLQSLLEAVISQVSADRRALRCMGSQPPVCLLRGMGSVRQVPDALITGDSMDSIGSQAAISTFTPLEALSTTLKAVSKAVNNRPCGRLACKMKAGSKSETRRTLTCCWGSC